MCTPHFNKLQSSKHGHAKKLSMSVWHGQASLRVLPVSGEKNYYYYFGHGQYMYGLRLWQGYEKNFGNFFWKNWIFDMGCVGLSPSLISLSLCIWLFSSFICTLVKLSSAGLGALTFVSVDWHWCRPLMLLLLCWRSHHLLLLWIVPVQSTSRRSCPLYTIIISIIIFILLTEWPTEFSCVFLFLTLHIET